nr:MAG TPA: Cro/C1-type HTH DNA-binding domain protein [Caudoviricetes sp.]
MTIGERIRKKREERGMTLEELSKYIDVSRQTMSRYETGAIKGVPSDKIELIASALRTTPAYLMGWEENPIIAQAARQAAFRAEIGDFTAEEMYLVRAYRNASNFERAFLDAAVYLVSRESAPQPQEEANPDGLLAAASLTRQYLQAQSHKETAEK